jgi:hypothetical protein
LRVIRLAEAEDFKNRIQKIELTINVKKPIPISFQTVVDSLWITENLSSSQIKDIENEVGALSNEFFILDNQTGIRKSFLELTDSISVFDKENWVQLEQTWDWDDATLEMSNKPRLKVKSLICTYEIHASQIKTTVGGSELALTLIKDAIENTSVFVDETGSLSGDTETLR